MKRATFKLKLQYLPAYTLVCSVLVSLVLSIVGLCVWKQWELGASGDIAVQFSLSTGRLPA